VSKCRARQTVRNLYVIGRSRVNVDERQRPVISGVYPAPPEGQAALQGLGNRRAMRGRPVGRVAWPGSPPPGKSSSRWFPQAAGAEEASVALEAAASKKPLKETTRGDFRGTAEEDVRLRRVGLRELWRQAECVGGP
jgi:hypothetical protein